MIDGPLRVVNILPSTISIILIEVRVSVKIPYIHFSYWQSTFDLFDTSRLNLIIFHQINSFCFALPRRFENFLKISH